MQALRPSSRVGYLAQIEAHILEQAGAREHRDHEHLLESGAGPENRRGPRHAPPQRYRERALINAESFSHERSHCTRT